MDLSGLPDAPKSGIDLSTLPDAKPAGPDLSVLPDAQPQPMPSTGVGVDLSQFFGNNPIPQLGPTSPQAPNQQPNLQAPFQPSSAYPQSGAQQFDQSPQGKAFGQGLAQGGAGVTPEQPSLQQQHPFFSGAGNLIGGVGAYGLASLAGPAGWAGVGELQNIVHQATDLNPENTNLNPVQRFFKPVTAAATNLLGYHLFANADLIGATVADMSGVAPRSAIGALLDQAKGSIGDSAIGQAVGGVMAKAGDAYQNAWQQMPQNVQLFKTVMERITAAGAGLGAANGIDSVAQDIESGKAPDIKNALTNFAFTAATGSILKGLMEIPRIGPNIIENAERITGQQGMTLKQASDFLTTGQVILKTPGSTKLSTISIAPDGKGGYIATNGDPAESTLPAGYRRISVTAPIDLKTLDPVLQSAVNEAKTKVTMQYFMGKGADDMLGIKSGIAKQLMAEKGYTPYTKENWINTLDEQIYNKISRATGQSAVPEWRSSENDPYAPAVQIQQEPPPGARGALNSLNPYSPNFNPDWAQDWYSKLNPQTAEQIKNLVTFRHQIAAGASPSDAIMNLQIVKNLNSRQILQAYTQVYENTSSKLAKEYLKSGEYKEGTEKEVAPGGTIDTVGGSGKKSSRVVDSMSQDEQVKHGKVIQGVADTINNYAKTSGSGVVIPDKLDPVMRQTLLDAVKKEDSSPTGNDGTKKAVVFKILGFNSDGSRSVENTTRNVSTINMQPNKQDAGDAPIHDWSTFSNMSIKDYAKNLKIENAWRKDNGYPEIDINKDLNVHRVRIAEQDPGLENIVRAAILREHDRAKNPMDIFKKKVEEAVQEPTIGTQPIKPSIREMTDLWAKARGPIHKPFGMQVEQSVVPSTPTDDEAVNKIIDKMKNPEAVPADVQNALEEYWKAAKNYRRAMRQDRPKVEETSEKKDQAEVDLKGALEQSNISKELYDKIWESRNITQTEIDLEVKKSPDTTLSPSQPNVLNIDLSHLPGVVIDLSELPDAKEIENKDLPPVEKVYHDEEKVKQAVVRMIVTNGDKYQLTGEEEHLLEDFKKNLLQEWVLARKGLPQYTDWEEKKFNADPRKKDLSGQNMDLVDPLKENELKVKEKAANFFKKPIDQITDENLAYFKKSQRKKNRQKFEDSKKTQAMREQVVSHHRIYDKYYLDLIKDFIGNMPEGNAKDIAVNAMRTIHHLVREGTETLSSNKVIAEDIAEYGYQATVAHPTHEVYKQPISLEHIGVAIEEINSHIKDLEQTMSFKSVENEASENKDDMDALAYEQAIDEKSAETPSDPEDMHEGPAWNDDMERIYKPFSDDDEDIQEMHTANPVAMMMDAMGLKGKIKIMQYGNEPQENSMSVILSVMRKFPLLAKLDDFFVMVGGERAAQLRAAQQQMRFSSIEALGEIKHFAMYEGQCLGMIRTILQPLHDDMNESIKQYLKTRKDLNVKGKEAFDKVFNMYMKLMAEASEQVLVRGYDPHKYAYSRLGQGPHASPEEAKAYFASMMRWYGFFQKTPTPQDIQRWQQGRTPDLWNLLIDQKVMNNNHLQKNILFYKAQIEMPLLIEQIKNGIYQNADIYSSIIQGYHMKNFTPIGEQQRLLDKAKNWFMGKQPLGNLNMPEAHTESQQAHVALGSKQGWLATNDYLNDNAEYMKRALLSIKQAQLLREISKLTLPKLEYAMPVRPAVSTATGMSEEQLEDNYRLDKLMYEVGSKNPSPYNWKKVHASTDKTVIAEAVRMSQLCGEEITAMRVLARAGFIQSHQDDGLNKWYRGSFSPPFVYKTLYDMIENCFRTSQNFDSLPGLVRILMYGKQMALIDPLVHVPQYIGNAVFSMPFKNVPGAPLVALGYSAGKAAVYFAKGAITGLKVPLTLGAVGISPKEIGKSDYEKMMARAYTERGATMVGAHNVFMANMIGKMDKGLFTARESRGDNLRNYLLSGWGTTPSVLGEMVGQQALRLMIRHTEELVANGMHPEKAMRLTVEWANTAFNNLNHVDWAGSRLGAFLQIASYSKNYAVMASRIMIMAGQTPVGGAALGGLLGTAIAPGIGTAVGAIAGARFSKGLKNNLFKHRSSGAGGGAGGNVFTGATVPPEFRENIDKSLTKMVASTIFHTVLFYSLCQYAAYEMDQDENKNPDEAFWWNNPLPVVGSVKLGIKNVNGVPMYATYNAFRLGKDMADILAPVIDEAYRKLTNDPNAALVGKNPVQVAAGKLSVIYPAMETAINHKFTTDGSKVYDSDEADSWKVAGQMAAHIFGPDIPINPWVGSGEIKVPLSDDPYWDMLLKSAALFGVQYKAGQPESQGTSASQLEADKRTLAHYEFNQQQIRSSINTYADAQQAYSDGQITQKQLSNYRNKFMFAANTWEKENKRNLLKAKMQQLVTMDNENL